jgi:methionine aminopeptidase
VQLAVPVNCWCKGISFPTCISVNHIVGNNSPLADDETVLADGDLVKIDLGAQIDGFCAPVGHSLVLGEATGRKADVLAAAATAVDAVLRLLNPGSSVRRQLISCVPVASCSFFASNHCCCVVRNRTPR